MSTAPAPLPLPRAPGAPARMRPPWPQARAAWAGISIVAMWLAVLFVGLFGGDIVSKSAGGDGSTVPAVVPLALFVLIATAVVARRGFAASREIDELRAELDEERRLRAALADEVARLREATPER